MHNGELTLTKLSSMSESLLGRSSAVMSTSMFPLKGAAWRQVRTSDKRTTCHPLLLTSYWLTERNRSNSILCRKKRRLLFNSSDVALVFLSNTYVWGQIELESCLNHLTVWQSDTDSLLHRNDSADSAHNPEQWPLQPTGQFQLLCSAQRPALLSAAWFRRRFSSSTVEKLRTRIRWVYSGGRIR